MRHHEYAALFPMLPDAELQSLANDIRDNGLETPIVTLEGAILDGRNRYKACEINGITPRCEEYTGDDPLGFVISHNLHRRHLSESQRALVAAKWARLKHGEVGNGRKVESPIGDSTHTETATRNKAAEMLKVGTTSIDRAKRAMKHGIPEIVSMMESGEISALAASQVSQLPKDEQSKAVFGGVAGVKEAAKKLKMEKDSKKNLDFSESVDTQSTNLESIKPCESSKPQRIPSYVPSEANLIWGMAKSQLVRIAKNDIQRVEALESCIKYCQERISQNK